MYVVCSKLYCCSLFIRLLPVGLEAVDLWYAQMYNDIPGIVVLKKR